MKKSALLKYDDREYSLPVVGGSEGEVGLDITRLRADTGLVTVDSGYKNTSGTLSAITFLDGEKGILRYRGYPIEELTKHSTFLEVSYLLIYGTLPTSSELSRFQSEISRHTLVHEDIKKILDGFPSNAHPMGVLSSLVCSLTAFYPESLDPNRAWEKVNLSILRILSKMPTFAAWAYKKEVGLPVMYPDNKLSYCANFLSMMFGLPTEAYQVNELAVRALDKLLILHADHEQNCSTSTVRLVGSAQASLYSSISAGINALWGPLHGGANQAVINMLESIQADGGDIQKYIARAKDKKDHFRLMGFGHRVYKNFDPRSVIIRKEADEVLSQLGVQDPVLDIAKKLEEIALKDEYFIKRKLYPNVDFYSGIIYRALGIPTEMFTVMFALGRLPGWIAQWKEMRENAEPIGRPRQIYCGDPKKTYLPLSKRT
ncbi:MAG: citrate synthase [Cytophagales bacterium]|nr:citrate synthase [Cytophagales bacterium]